jgi:branched-chain amino acid transport system substrate-binding protein
LARRARWPPARQSGRGCGGTHAQGAPLKIGLVLPYTGVYAVLGESITQAMELVFARENWTVAGRKIEMIKEDDEMKPPVGIRKTEKLIDSTRSTS